MSAGTISIKNNAAAVAGNGTAFPTELSAGDFIVITTGGVTYTLPVKSIESETALTLSRNYSGPDITAGAWTAMPRDTLNRISAQIAADTAYAIRQRVLEIDNWYQLLEVNGDVTIKMADGSSYTGPSWLRLVDIMNTLDIDQLIPVAGQVRADAAQVAADKPVIIQAKDDAEAAAAAAAVAEGSTSAAEVAAAAAREAAQQAQAAAEKAAEEAASHNPVEALVKSNNLSDLENREESWMNVRPVGSTPLAADPVGDYDAATKRWTENLVGAGTTGPTMNGVMNFGIGKPLMHATRAYIPPYELPLDGQIVNRADWPELWAWAQMTSPHADAEWQTDIALRGGYSTGDGSTTFRLPDWNGVQKNGVNGITGPDSVPNLYFRGTGESTKDMGVMRSAAPNISGQLGTVGSGAFSTAVNARSALNPYGTAYPDSISPKTGNQSAAAIQINANNSSPVYGRYSTNTIQTDVVNGVWVVRASGGFVAANTSWSVTNGDATRPADEVVANGGDVKSQYKIAGAVEAEASFKMTATMGGTYAARITVTNSTKSTSASFDFTDAGNFETPRGRALVVGDYGVGMQSELLPTVRNNAFISDSNGSSAWAPSNGGGFQTSYGDSRITQFWVAQGSDAAYIRRNTVDNNPQRSKSATPWVTLQTAGTSDANVKTILDDLDLDVPLSNINNLEFKTFRYNKDGEDGPVRRGIIAQQAQTVDPEYVHSAEASGVMTLDSNPLLLDALAAVKALLIKCDLMKAEIDELKAALKS